MFSPHCCKDEFDNMNPNGSKIRGKWKLLLMHYFLNLVIFINAVLGPDSYICLQLHHNTILMIREEIGLKFYSISIMNY